MILYRQRYYSEFVPKFRQKEYSSPLTRGINKYYKLINNIEAGAAEAGANITSAIRGKSSSKSILEKSRASRVRKSKRELAKKSIQIRQDLENKVIRAKDYVSTATPGKAVSDVIGVAAKKGPLVMASTAAQAAGGFYIPGLNGIVFTLGNKTRVTRKFNEWVSKLYEKHKGKVERGVDMALGVPR